MGLRRARKAGCGKGKGEGVYILMSGISRDLNFKLRNGQRCGCVTEFLHVYMGVKIFTCNRLSYLRVNAHMCMDVL